LRVVISSLESFASQYTSLEADKAQLQKEVKSSSSKLEGAIKIAAEARQEVDSLKEELEGLKKRLRDEEASRLAAEARVIEKDDLLHQSSVALLSNSLSAFLLIIALRIQSFVNELILFRSSQRLPISLSRLWTSFRTIPRRTLYR
jgi:TPP-dependent trihydroxycyclohexane-1,2-dione (THcHDO) dehydratase